MVHFTLSRAAKEAGVSKSTLSKALSNGRLSGERLADGSFHIEASELFRVFPKRTAEANGEQTLVTVREPPGTPTERPLLEMDALQLKVRMLEDQLARERELRDQERETSQETVMDLRKRLDRSEERILALTANGAGSSPAPSTAVPATQKPRAGFFSRLLGRD